MLRFSHMRSPIRFPATLLLLSVWTSLACAAFGQSSPIRLSVDATDASKGILHARLRIPVRPGPLTLVYPKWIPGEHGPTGPITDLAGLKFSIASASLTWERDAEDMFAF